ncbi:MAG TPA: lactate utilization protein C [Micromonosporaceae bacterium]|nr:lactate utilization protein C [Micromonosporaceae bacterium]
MNARDDVLARLRAARGDTTAPAVPRDYRRTGETDPVRLAALLTDRLLDYKSGVIPCPPAELPAALRRLLAGIAPVAVPPDLPEGWLTGYPGVVVCDGEPRPFTMAELDGAGAVVTGCALAIAETGTLVLDAGPAQGRRALTLVPDHHICVVHIGQVVATVPEALARLADPTRPLTFVSGPSATSDIELNRVEGVHGPRRLDVVLVS